MENDMEGGREKNTQWLEGSSSHPQPGYLMSGKGTQTNRINNVGW